MGKRAEERGAVMHMKWATVAFLTLTLVIATTGCGEDEVTAPSVVTSANVDSQTPPTTEKSTAPAGPVDIADDEVSIEDDADHALAAQDYFYDPREKRDPFRSFRFADDVGPDTKEFGPLGDFELGQLELSAVIWDANNPRALILDPGGRSYIVREGSQIGKNSGQVIHIGDNLVLVKETYENLAGERTTKDVELRIRLSQGG
jgi:Tfp pilus assembly protein PilP